MCQTRFQLIFRRLLRAQLITFNLKKVSAKSINPIKSYRFLSRQNSKIFQCVPSMFFQDESLLWNNTPLLSAGIDESKKVMQMSEYVEQNPRAAEDTWLQSWPSQSQKRPTFSLWSLEFWRSVTGKLGAMRGFRLWICFSIWGIDHRRMNSRKQN